jgi:predicted PurR-regulated permease PerM
MNKGVIAIVFTIIFASFSVVPSILTLVDDTYDISVLISSAEEEEKKGEEKIKNFETEVPSKETIEYNNYSNSLVKLLSNHSDNYNSLFKELTSPPPEFNI